LGRRSTRDLVCRHTRGESERSVDDGNDVVGVLLVVVVDWEQGQRLVVWGSMESVSEEAKECAPSFETSVPVESEEVLEQEVEAKGRGPEVELGELDWGQWSQLVDWRSQLASSPSLTTLVKIEEREVVEAEPGEESLERRWWEAEEREVREWCNP
jgi:hypothetical protein